MDSPIASLYKPQEADESAGPAAAPVTEPGKIVSPISSLYAPPTDRRSAEEVMYRGRSTGKDWADTKKQLEAEGYRTSPEMGTHYEKQRALQTEREKQGQGVSVADQAVRNLIPFGSALINNRRESAYADAAKRYQDGKATQEDYQTIAAHDRRAKADEKINSTTAGQLLNIPLQAPAIIGESLAGGKLVGAAGKALGIGQTAAQGTARAVVNFAGKQALTTPLMPSMYLQHANDVNIKAGRDPNDIRGFAPALGLAYANNLVLGSLQKYGGGGNLLQQAAKKGAIGVGEQAIADVAAGGIDEFLPDAYKMKTRYGVLGDLARGDVSKGLGHATIQALTFSYFSALHGKSPDKVKDAFGNYLDASRKVGDSPEKAAEAANKVMGDLYEHLKGQMADAAIGKDKTFTREDARDFLDSKYVDAIAENMHPEQAKAFRKLTDGLAETFEPRADVEARDAANREAMAKKKTPLMLEGKKPEAEAQVSEPTPEAKPPAEVAPSETKPAVATDAEIAAKLKQSEAWVKKSPNHPLVQALRGQTAARDVDPITGYGRASERNAASAEALGATKRGEKRSYVDMDIANTKGVGDAVGDSRLRGHIADMTKIVENQLREDGHDPKMFRQGMDAHADEFAAVVKGDQKAVEASLEKAKAKIAEYTKLHKLSDIAHTKEGKAPGTGVNTGVAEFKAGKSAQSTFAEAESGTGAKPPPRPLSETKGPSPEVANETDEATTKTGSIRETQVPTHFPPVRENYLRPLSDFGPELWRDTNAENADSMLPNSLSSNNIPFGNKIYLSPTPDMAHGQDESSGVLMRMDAHGISGQVNTSKPTWSYAYEHGQAEFLSKNKYEDFRSLVKEVEFDPKAKGTKGPYGVRVRRMLDSLVREEGWSKRETSDGKLVYSRPDIHEAIKASETKAPSDLHPEVVKSAHEIGGAESVKNVEALHEAATAPEVTEAHVAEAEKAVAESIKELSDARAKAVDDISRGTDRSGEPAVAGEPHGSEPGKLAAETEGSGVQRANQDADRTHAEAAAKPRKPRQAKGEAVKVSSGIDLLKSASKKTGVTWMEGRQDPIAEEILSGPDADKIAAEIPPGSKYLSSGVSSIAFRTPAGDVIRIEPRAPESPTKISSPDIIKPLKSKRIGGTEITHVPFADTKSTTEADVAELKGRLEKQGIDWHDAGTDNAGRLVDGRLVVIDRGSVRKAPKPAKKGKKTEKVGPADRIRSINEELASLRAEAEADNAKLNALPMAERAKRGTAHLDKIDARSAELRSERRSMEEKLADESGTEFAVHVVDGPGGLPREVSRHASLREATSKAKEAARREMRDESQVASTQDVKNELGEKAVATRYSGAGKQVFVGRVARAPKEKPAEAKHKTIIDYIKGYGGIASESLSPAERAQLREAGLGHVFQSDKKAKGNNAFDTLAEHLRNEGYLPHDSRQNPTDQLMGALLSRKVVEHSEAKGDHELQEHWKKQQESAKGERFTGGEQTAEDIPFSRGGPAGEGTESHRLVAEQNKLFGNRNYVEKSVPGAPGDVNAAARLKERATVTGKRSAGDAEINLEEHAHHIQQQYGLGTDPAGFPLVVAKGIQQFFSYRAKAYGVSETTPSRTGMIEGFADWLIARSKGDLKGLSMAEEVANKYLERWAAEKGLTEKFDKLKELYKDFHAQAPEAKAAGLVSSTGQPEAPPRTTKEALTDLANKAQENIDDSLAVLNRIGADAEANGAPKGLAKRVKAIWSQLMYADPHRAAEFERDGVHTYEDGRKKVIGLPFEKIIEGAKPEWVAEGPNKTASRAGVYAVARHILGEETRGRDTLVSNEQLEAYRAAFAEMGKDAGFKAWAEAFSDRLTDGFNATRRALAGKDVHFLSPEEVSEWEKKFPDYIPTDRVMQDQGWKASGGARGESPRKVTGERSGSGEQIVDPLISYKNRLRVTSAVMGEQLKRIELEKLVKAAGGKWGLSSGSEKLTALGELRAETLEKLGFTGENLRDILKDMGLSRAEEYFTQRPWPTDGTKPTWGLKGPDGKLVNYRIGDRDLYNLATGQQLEANATASWIRATASFLPVKWMTQAVKFGATSASLGFQFRNVPRDIYTFYANTVDRAGATPGAMADSYKRAFAYSWHQLTNHFDGAPSQDALYKRFAADRGLDQRQFTFEKDNPASAYAPSETKGIKEAHTVWGILKDVLNLAGAGENAPRFLEWKNRILKTAGKTEAELTRELEAAEAAQKAGKPIPDPIPFAEAMDGMEHAAEVTVNFNRLGTVTREVNKITPFFGPAIAGLSKSVRNWKENPKGAAFAMSGLLAARLLHWAMFSDEDWYKELNSNDRFNNFVVPTPAGLRRLPAPRDLEVAGGGLLITALDAAAKKNPDFKGLLRESLGAVAPPVPVPPAAKVGYEIARNENWMGSPIVPKRDENKSAQDKWTEDRAPYAADQLTGGLLSARKIPSEAKDLIPYSEVRNARRSVDDFYERFHDLEEQWNKALKSGKRFEQQAEYHRLNAAQEQIVTLGRAVRGDRMVNGRVVKGEPPTPEKAQELRAKQIQVARKALGTE